MLLAIVVVTPTLIIMPALAQSSQYQTVMSKSKDDIIITIATGICKMAGTIPPYQSVCQGYDGTIGDAKRVMQKVCQIYSAEGKEQDIKKMDKLYGFDICAYVKGPSGTNPQTQSTTVVSQPLTQAAVVNQSLTQAAVVSQPPAQAAVGTQLPDYTLIAMAVGALLIAMVVGALLMMRRRKAGPATLTQPAAASARAQPQSTAQPGLSFCINCGKQIPMKSPFCNFCGSAQV